MTHFTSASIARGTAFVGLISLSLWAIAPAKSDPETPGAWTAKAPMPAIRTVTF